MKNALNGNLLVETNTTKKTRRKATDFMYLTYCECCRKQVEIEEYRKDQLYAKDHRCEGIIYRLKTLPDQYKFKNEEDAYNVIFALVYRTYKIDKALIANGTYTILKNKETEEVKA